MLKSNFLQKSNFFYKQNIFLFVRLKSNVYVCPDSIDISDVTSQERKANELFF